MNFTKMKNINEMMMVMIVVSCVSALASGVFLMSGLKHVATEYREGASVHVAIPFMTMQASPYDAGKYADIKKMVTVSDAVKIESTTDRLVISASSTENESQWRRSVSDALSLDKNLHAIRVCGSATNACSGVALVAELAGEQKTFLIKE